ncbi:YraN family protein [Acidipropionibacterium timonense]|uniref:YraN family protein n=1 Tax=Acidipropionibacterium timonense TaxID=2161818 RepID=UPI001030A736|nr:YraN family protein [Acidipropionibacterium timonense]
MPIAPVPSTVPTTRQGAALRARRGSRNHVAAWGEDVAVAHLEALGWTILARNWACRGGEIDIVARDPDDWVVVVEVKTRSGRGYGDPLEAVTPAKVRKLSELALTWLVETGEYVPRIRLDAIGVVRVDGGPPEISHVRGIRR